MMNNALRRKGPAMAVLCATVIGGVGLAVARDELPRFPVHFVGLLNDYTPSAALTKGGPYEMRGKWRMDVDERRGTARFSAEMNMETSDFGITQGTVDKDNPTTRGAHTHHILVTDGMVSHDWAASCPTFSPAVTEGFVVTGSAFVTGNGGGAPFGNPSSVTLCVLGSAVVKYSNLTLTFAAPASSHFGKQAIHGVVVHCDETWERDSQDCTVQE